MKSKYVIFKTTDGKELAVIFHRSLIHAEVSDAMCRVRDENRKRHVVGPVSAGFCYLETGNRPEYVASGKSESLNLESRPQDSLILSSLLW